MVSRRMASRAWLLIVVAALCTGTARVHAQASGLGPWEQSQFRLAVSPLWPTSDGTTYGNVGNSLHRSDDDGMTFTKVTLPGLDNARVVAVDPHDRNHLYLAAGAVYRSDDGGATLSAVYTLAPTTRGTEANPQERLQTSEQIDEMVVSAVDRHLLYLQLLTVETRWGPRGSPIAATTATRLLRSRDGGGTWDEVFASSAPSCGRYQSGPQQYVLYPHPKDAQRVFRSDPCATEADGGRGLWYSEDQGTTWTLGFDVPGATLVQVVAGGDAETDRLYARFFKPASKPDVEPDGALYRSDDGGLTWTPLPIVPTSGSPELLGNSYLGNLAVKPGPVDRLFLHTRHRGGAGAMSQLLSSADNGVSWAHEPTEGRVGPSARLVISADGRYLFLPGSSLLPGNSGVWRREIQ